MKNFVAELLRGGGRVSASGIANPRERSWIIGDVRLDAREELREALRAAGIGTADDVSDDDLVLAAWSVWRERATERLRGDYSFALWDHGQRTLFCARDPLGIRPLYWAEPAGAFVCGNVLDAVRAHPGLSSRLHEPAIVSFLRHGFNDDASTTSFAGVHRLAPAHQLLVRDGQGAGMPTRHWSFPVPEPLRLRREEEYVARFRDVLGAAVRDRLRTDRAAILLSGGLDSTSLAATACRVAPATRLSAWTNDSGATEPEDEVRLATAVARRLGLAHEVDRDGSLPLAHLGTPGFRTPEPLDEPEWGAWRRQLERISCDATVLVIGEDGDALFRPPGLRSMMRAWPAHDVMRRVLSYILARRRHPDLGIHLRRRLLAPFARGELGPPAWLRREAIARTSERRPAAAAPHPTRADAVRRLTDPVWQSVLEPAQPSYTGVPVDIVWPLLDTRVIEFVFAVPPVPWCQRKELVRRAFRGDLPEAVLLRRKSPLRGFFERQVAQWRASRKGAPWEFGEAIGEFVDTRSVVHTLNTGSVECVLAAWRVLALDQWLRSADGVRSS